LEFFLLFLVLSDKRHISPTIGKPYHLTVYRRTTQKHFPFSSTSDFIEFLYGLSKKSGFE